MEVQANTVGCQLQGVKRQRVYTLLLNPGIHNNWFQAFDYVPRKKITLCGQCEKEDSRNIGRTANVQEAIVRQRTQSSTVTDVEDSTKMLDKKDKNHADSEKEPMKERVMQTSCDA